MTMEVRADVFLDRDGVLIRNRPDYVKAWDEVEVLPGALDAVSRLHHAGHRVIVVPVNHRPRRFGLSHYGVRNRAWRGVVDMFGVRWLQARRLRYEAREEPPEAS